MRIRLPQNRQRPAGYATHWEVARRYEIRERLIELGLWEEFRERLHKKIKKTNTRPGKVWNQTLSELILEHVGSIVTAKGQREYVRMLLSVNPTMRRPEAEEEAAKCALLYSKGSDVSYVSMDALRKRQGLQEEKMRASLRELGQIESYDPLVRQYISGGDSPWDAKLRAYHELRGGSQGRQVVWE